MREQYLYARHIYERELDTYFRDSTLPIRVGLGIRMDSPTPSSGNIDPPPMEIKTPAVEMRSIEENELDPTDGNW